MTIVVTCVPLSQDIVKQAYFGFLKHVILVQMLSFNIAYIYIYMCVCDMYRCVCLCVLFIRNQYTCGTSSTGAFVYISTTYQLEKYIRPYNPIHSNPRPNPQRYLYAKIDSNMY